jgi:hypothetical protein
MKVPASYMPLWAIALLLWVGGSCQAQKAPDSLLRSPHDVLLLNNGALVRGTIVAREEGKSVTVVLLGGSTTMKIPWKRIEMITSSEADFHTRQREIIDSLHPVLPPGPPIPWAWTIKGRAATGEDGSIISLSGSLGWRFSTGLLADIGLGVDRHANALFLPAMAGVTWFVKPSAKCFPYLRVAGGFSLGRVSNRFGAENGGVRYESGVGVRLLRTGGPALMFELGYVHQALSIAQTAFNSSLDLTSVSVGFLF